MAKKAIKPQQVKKTEIKTKVKNEESLKDIQILESAINESSAPPEVIQETKDVLIGSEEIKNEEVQTTNEVIKQTEIIEEVKKEEVKKEEVKTGLSIWDDLKKPTEEDANINKGGGIVDNLAEEASAVNEDFEKYTEQQANEQAYKVKAGVIVELLDVVFMIICTIITWDFSSDNQKKFSLHKDRKKAIQFNLFQLYKLEGKRVDPKKAIWTLILGSYAPLLIVAFITMFNNFKRRKEEKESKILEQEKKQEDRLHIEAILRENEYLRNNQNNSIPENHFKNREIVRAENIQHETIKTKKKKPKKEPIFIHTEIKKTRGVKAGVKRGSYNKKKK